MMEFKNFGTDLALMKVYKNEVVWTDLVAKLAMKNSKVFEYITTFQPQEKSNIYCEAQPLTPYKSSGEKENLYIEDNSHLDMVLGAISIRKGTISGIHYNKENGKEVCFLEAKYFSDISYMTEHNPVRNQIARVIENLLYFNNKDKKNPTNEMPKKIVFTLLTPRRFKVEKGTRLYSDIFDEYNRLLADNQFTQLIKKIELSNSKDDKRECWQADEYIGEKLFQERLKHFTMNWITFEDIFDLAFSGLFVGKDLIKEKDADYIYKMISNIIYWMA